MRTEDPEDRVDVDALIARFREHTARIGVIGLGYVGLPLLRTAAERGFSMLGVAAPTSSPVCAPRGGSKRPTISRA